jgi:hypothetical protein
VSGSKRVQVTLAAILAVSSLAAPAIGGEPQIATVGALEPISIATPHPYPTDFGQEPMRWIVEWPGATYVRVHFSAFDLAPGDAVTLSSLDGRERYRFEGRGPHGTGSFWANSILGGAAVIELEARLGGGFGFEIDSFGRGTQDLIERLGEPGGEQGVESVCGTTDWRDVECYRSSYATEFEKARGSVKALIGCCSACTAFKVSDSGQFMTNNHCTSTQSGVQSTELRFEYQNTTCGGTNAPYSGSVLGSQLLATDYTLDYTLMTTGGDSSSIPCLELDPRLPPVGERIYIAGHPSGGPKKLSIESDRNTGGLCRVDASPTAGRAANSDIGYYCDTTNGSSGSPVLSGDTHKVVGLHHLGGCLNTGARIDLIYNQISNTLDSCQGGGGSPACGDGTCSGGETSCSCPEDCGAPPATETSCSNGIDDDCDTLTDCADSNCGGTPECPSCKPSGTSCSSNSECCSSICASKGKSGKRTCK